MAKISQTYMAQLHSAVADKDGPRVERLLNVSNSDALAYVRKANRETAQREIRNAIPAAWHETVTAFLDSLTAMVKSDYKQFFACYEKHMTALNRVANGELKWILPALKQAANTINKMAKLCSSDASQLNEKLEMASRCVNGAFKVCLNDRNSDDLTQTKKVATYFFAGMMLRLYFRLKAYSLGKGIVKAINAVSQVLPPLSQSSIADQVVYEFYCGVLEFMAQKYGPAESILTTCFHKIPLASTKARETVLLYLIPAKQLVGGQTPSETLWQEFPALAKIYRPMLVALKQGEVQRYDALLTQNQSFFVKRHLYFAFTKLAQSCALHLICRTWRVLGKSNRLRIDDLERAFALMGFFGDIYPSEDDKLNAVELMTAQLISDGAIKGYISHSLRTIVLSNRNPFPSLVRQANGN